MLLIHIGNYYNEAHIAKILSDLLDNKYKVVFAFNDNHIAKQFFTKYPECKNQYITETEFIILNGHLFNGFITLGSAPIMRATHMVRSILIDYFNTIGVPTIDVQHGLFQYGINKVDIGLKIGSGEGETFGIPMHKVSKYQIKWGGKEGIGYIKSELEKQLPEDEVALTSKMTPFTLIVTNYHSPTYSDANKKILLEAIHSLVLQNSDISFVWKPHPAEFNRRHLIFSKLLELVSKGKLPNLKILTAGDISTATLVANCANAISTTSTTLLNMEFAGKKALVFRCENNQHIIDEFEHLSIFCDREDLIYEFKKMISGQDSNLGLISSGLGEFKPQKLKESILELLDTSKNDFSTSTAIEYLRMYKYYEVSIRKMNEARKQPIKPADPKAIAVIPKVAKNVSNNKPKPDPELKKMLKLFNEITTIANSIQKRTLAYKMLSSFKRVKTGVIGSKKTKKGA